MSTVGVVLAAFGLICFFYVPYMLIILRETKRDRDRYFDLWKESVDKNSK